jgi:hypothetical protein
MSTRVISLNAHSYEIYVLPPYRKRYLSLSSVTFKLLFAKRNWYKKNYKLIILTLKIKVHHYMALEQSKKRICLAAPDRWKMVYTDKKHEEIEDCQWRQSVIDHPTSVDNSDLNMLHLHSSRAFVLHSDAPRLELSCTYLWTITKLNLKMSSLLNLRINQGVVIHIRWKNPNSKRTSLTWSPSDKDNIVQPQLLRKSCSYLLSPCHRLT